MSQDIVTLPADLATDSRILYRGAWLSEIRQTAIFDRGVYGVLREIWVRLPSGRDRKWLTNEPTFSALAGHQVGALVSVGRDGGEFVLGMVNYDTGESRIFWRYERFGRGCALWILLAGFGCLAGFYESTIAIWLGLFVVLTILTIRFRRAKTKERAYDLRRFGVLVAAGPSDWPEGTR